MRRAVIGMMMFSFLCVAVVAGAQSAEEWADKGFNATDPELKIEYYTKAIELDPKYAKAYNNRGWAYYLMGDYNRALEDVTKAFTYIDADDIDTLSGAFGTRANIYREQGRYDEAMKDVEKQIELVPEYNWAYYTRGQIYRAIGEVEKARADFTKACKMGKEEACDALYDLGD